MMDLEEEFESEHLFFHERKCRVCGELKDLRDGYYKTHKGRGDIPSAYSYECKRCTIKRVKEGRKKDVVGWVYPDW